MKTVGRISLYERVWAFPKRDVAIEFGVTSDRLSRLCRRNKIPIPVQGFWNRGPEDRAALKVPLPDPGQDWEITVEASAGHVPQELPVRKVGIPVPEKLNRPHPLLCQTRSGLLETKKDIYGRHIPGEGCLQILVSHKCRQRAYRIMDVLLKECEKRGWTVAIPAGRRGGTVVTANGGEVPVILEEMLGRALREPTDHERERRGAAIPVYAHFPSGRLMLSLGDGSFGGRRVWREGKRASLEDLLGSFLAGVGLAGMREKEITEADAKAARERREKADREFELKRAQAAEQARVDELLAHAEAWQQSQNLRAYIKAYEKQIRSAARKVDAKIAPGGEVERWFIWARQQADRLDPLKSSPPSVLDTKTTNG